MKNSLGKIETKLKTLLSENPSTGDYRIPSLWENPYEFRKRPSVVNPYRFFLNSILKIRQMGAKKQAAPPAEFPVVYNIFPRYTTAYRHQGGETISAEPFGAGFRETGTFLKVIGMLPYIKSLGADILYMLPVTSIGRDGRKGALGSPYAIKNPYKLDENLSEPFLDMDIKEEFSALVEAAGLAGIKVVVEFVFRTASIDCDNALEHPRWFYWIKANIQDRPRDSRDEKKFGMPLFSESQLPELKEKVSKGLLKGLPEPGEQYKNMYIEAPGRTALVNGKIRGVTNKGQEGRIPGAFCDWPPDDVQPPWNDVTYLRLYDHKDYNYMAYNTIRMYEEKLAKRENRVGPLWDYITGIIPYYQDNFGIDGVMIDMGHALPNELRRGIINKAREKNRNFIFWEENFSLTKSSAKEGYQAAVGWLWTSQHIPGELKRFLKILSYEEPPLAFFASPETHNTPRAATRNGGQAFSKAAFVMNAFLPGYAFIHSGYELGEEMPVNTGLGFSAEDQKKYPPEKLPLFSISSVNWENENYWGDFLRSIIQIRKKYKIEGGGKAKQAFEYLETSMESVCSFARKINPKEFILIAVNFNAKNELYFNIKLPKNTKTVKGISDNQIYTVKNDGLIHSLKPMDFMICKLTTK